MLKTIIGLLIVAAVCTGAIAVNKVNTLEAIHKNDIGWMKEILIDMKEVYEKNKASCNE